MKMELLEKAREAKSVEELLELAKKNGMEITAEDAAAYFSKLNHTAQSGELSDDELDNVAGGACHTDEGYTVVSSGLKCFNDEYVDNWDNLNCEQYVGKGGGMTMIYNDQSPKNRKAWYDFACTNRTCGSCANLQFDGELGYCWVREWTEKLV